MNWQYDTAGAGHWLNSYMARIEQEGSSMNTLSTLDLSTCHVARFGEPPCLRLVTGEGSELEEVTCRVAGVISSKVLPPFYGPLRSTQFNHVKKLRQYVRLTGLGSENFHQNQRILDGVTALFEGVTAPGHLEGMGHALYEGEFAIDTHTRYLTERRLVPSLRHIPFPPEIDPAHVLEEARDIHFIRTPDNIVEYRVRRDAEDGQPRYDEADPSVFKEGDLVEASVTFLAFPLGRDDRAGDANYKLVVTLRGLTLLNNEFREVSEHPLKCSTADASPALSPPKSSASSRDLTRTQKSATTNHCTE